jgi:DNA-binding XRE family transcriptional regulator
MNTRFFEIKIQIRGLSFDNPPPVVVEVVSSSKIDDSVNNDNLQVLTVTLNDVELPASAEVTWQYLLTRAGLTESDLAERAGIGLRIIQDWKKRRKMPRLDSATAVADALGATLDEIAFCMGLERKG